MKKKFILLFLIIIIASFLRLWHLGQVPPSPDWDEASLGYNAYSIMQTGKDEYGEFLPFILRSFDDYKPGLYAYFIIPFIKFLGLNIVSVRLPSAIFGILTVLATYFLINELFKKRNLALFTSFLLAISPWHIQFSRIAFESNVGLAFNVFSALFFIKGLKKPWFLVLSFILGAVNLYIYQSEKVFTPLLFLTLIVIFRKELFAVPKRYISLAVVLAIIVSLPLANYMFFNKDALARAKGVSVFSNQTEFLKENVDKIAKDKENKDVLGLILDNRRVDYAKAIFSGYISHFDLNWLFFQGDIARHHAPNMGLLYLWELPFLLIGIYLLAFGNFDKKIKFFIFSWFLLAPIPASITSGVPHAVRTLNFLPTFQVFAAIGVMFVFSKISNIKNKIADIQIKFFIFSFIFLFLIFNFSYYLNQYLVQQNYFNSPDWQYGFKETVEEVKKIENKYDKIIVSNQPHLDQSYMFFLFYLKYPPLQYQQESLDLSGGFKENHHFGKYEFRPISWNEEEKKSNILYVGRPGDFSSGAKIIQTINFLDGKPAIKIVEK